MKHVEANADNDYAAYTPRISVEVSKMPVKNVDVGTVVQVCQRHRHRVRYGVLGAAISARAGNPRARSQNYANATVTMLNKFFGGRCPSGSWVVDERGYPTGYGTPLNEKFDPNWTASTPLHEGVAEFLAWLDATAPGWDSKLQSTYP